MSKCKFCGRRVESGLHVPFEVPPEPPRKRSTIGFALLCWSCTGSVVNMAAIQLSGQLRQEDEALQRETDAP
jgi:hypothetical protein